MDPSLLGAGEEAVLHYAVLRHIPAHTWVGCPHSASPATFRSTNNISPQPVLRPSHVYLNLDFHVINIIKLQSDFNIRSEPECKRGRNQIYCTKIQRYIQDVFRRLEIRSRLNLTHILIQLLYVK